MSALPNSIEVELKLLLPNNHLEGEVIDYLKQKGYKTEKTDPIKNIDIYLDTGDWALLKNGFSLRYRTVNNQAVYTMKSTDTIENDGIAKRTEIEIALKKPARAPSAIPIKELKDKVKDIISPRILMEQILIRTNRHPFIVESVDGARFQLSFDTSNFYADAIYTPRCTAHRYEMEAELVEGPVTAIDELAAVIADKFAFPAATASKLLSAMDCLKIEPVSKKIPEDMKIKLEDTLDVALKKIMTVEFKWFQQQLRGVAEDRDPEFVHQARVATRRMRSAIILFHNAMPEQQAVYLEQRLKWLGKLLGEVRDIDVFIINLDNYKNNVGHFPKPKRKALKALAIKHRREPLKALNSALNSRRFKSFKKRMEQFICTSTLNPGEEPAQGVQTVGQIAPQIIAQRLESLISQSRKTLASTQLCEYHSLRILMKRLRYALEFMAPPYGNVFDDFVDQTIEIQDCLGAIQDTVFNQELIEKIFNEWKGKLVDPELIFILGELYQYQGETARRNQMKFQDIWKRFSNEQNMNSIKQVFGQITLPEKMSLQD
jgi:CHAD domain-containing protein